MNLGRLASRVLFSLLIRRAVRVRSAGDKIGWFLLSLAQPALDGDPLFSKLRRLYNSPKSTFQIGLKQLENPLVLIRPTRRLHKPMILNRVNRQFPIRFSKLDQSLHQPNSVLKVDVYVDHPVADQ